jgi:UDP-glucose-4-epimerase GalE
MKPRAVVTGGAGFIGGHMVRLLIEAGFEVTVIDNLSTGHRDAVDERASLRQIDLCHPEATRQCLQEVRPAIVFHFAALSLVGESMEQPWRYLAHNVQSTLHLLQAMQAADCRKLVHSSSCAIYGTAEQVPMKESHAVQPLSPYGESKLICEELIEAACQQREIDAVALRYFNVAGCGDDPHLQEQHEPETHLVPNLLLAAGSDTPFNLFGTAHPTPDGTAIRDYIHVQDLVAAHLLAGERLCKDEAEGFLAFNLGSGRGYSVREVLDTAQAITGLPIHVVTHPARAGDPPELRADTTAWRQWAGSEAASRDLEAMVASAWQAMQAEVEA